VPAPPRRRELAIRRERARPVRDVVVAPLSLDPALYQQAPLDGPPTAGLIGTNRVASTAAALRTLLEDDLAAGRADAQLVIARRGTERFGGMGEVQVTPAKSSSSASRSCSSRSRAAAG
jgi:hypothetical protein